jgi:hypothetical protein
MSSSGLSGKPVLPRITDPSLLPQYDVKAAAERVPGASDNTDDESADNTENVKGRSSVKGLFTSVAENKLIVLIIVLIIVIISIVAYFVIGKHKSEEGVQDSAELDGQPPTGVMGKMGKLMGFKGKKCPLNPKSQTHPGESGEHVEESDNHRHEKVDVKPAPKRNQVDNRIMPTPAPTVVSTAVPKKQEAAPIQDLSHENIISSMSIQQLEQMRRPAVQVEQPEMQQKVEVQHREEVQQKAEVLQAQPEVQQHVTVVQNSPPADFDLQEYLKSNAAKLDDVDGEDIVVNVVTDVPSNVAQQSIENNSQNVSNDIASNSDTSGVVSGSSNPVTGGCHKLLPAGRYCRNRAVMGNKCRAHADEQ